MGVALSPESGFLSFRQDGTNASGHNPLTLAGGRSKKDEYGRSAPSKSLLRFGCWHSAKYSKITTHRAGGRFEHSTQSRPEPHHPPDRKEDSAQCSLAEVWRSRLRGNRVQPWHSRTAPDAWFTTGMDPFGNRGGGLNSWKFRTSQFVDVFGSAAPGTTPGPRTAIVLHRLRHQHRHNHDALRHLHTHNRSLDDRELSLRETFHPTRLPVCRHFNRSCRQLRAKCSVHMAANPSEAARQDRSGADLIPRPAARRSHASPFVEAEFQDFIC